MSTTHTRHEPTAWMREAIAAKVALVDSLHLEDGTVVVTPLGSTAGKDDRTCDRCRRYVPKGPPFYVDMVRPRPTLNIVVGLCASCRDLERGGR